jgi:S1-C subfamily serine protease
MIRALTLAMVLLVASVSCGHGTGGRRGSEILPRKSYVFIKKFVKLKKCIGDTCHEGKFASVGSGFVIDVTKKGSYVGTASHVCYEDQSKYILGVKVESKLMVEALDGREYDAQIVDHDPNIDICVMFVEHMVSGIERVVIADEKPKEGDKVYNIASPHGIHYKNVVPIFEGRYIGQRGDAAFYTFDAAPGSSGSMILNREGELVGVLHSVFVKMQSIIVAVTFEDMKSFIYESVSKHKKDNGLMFDISSLPSPFQPGMKI